MVLMLLIQENVLPILMVYMTCNVAICILKAIEWEWILFVVQIVSVMDLC